jgi:hypothetical protein
MMHAETESRAIGADGSPARPLGYYEYIATPPIQLVLNVILRHAVGASFSPGVRVLADESGVSRGMITDCLRQLATDGWILYDGRMITLLRATLDDAIDQVIDQSEEIYCDRSIDRSPDLVENGTEAEIYCDRSPDRSRFPPAPPMVFNITTADSVVVSESSTIGGSGGIFPNDRSPDRSHPAALMLTELGLTPGPGVFERGMAARDWTPQQIRDRYESDKPRIENSGGTKTWGIFWTAFMAGELAPPRPDPDRPIDVAAYANQPGFSLGSDLAPPGDAATIRDHASRLLPPPTARTIREHTRDWIFLQGRLAQGDSDETALQALEARRSAVRR